MFKIVKKASEKKLEKAIYLNQVLVYGLNQLDVSPELSVSDRFSHLKKEVVIKCGAYTHKMVGGHMTTELNFVNTNEYQKVS